MTLVLVIDDEPINHQLVARALEPLECKIHSAQNGNEGLSLAKKLKPDIIITDVMMPDMNGYELTRTLRREPEFAATPILVLTAQSGLEAKIQSFEAGADDHLTKPFEAAELAARVTALLRRLEAAKAPRPEAAPQESACMIAVHSLRGGTGCSSLAVKLGRGPGWSLAPAHHLTRFDNDCRAGSANAQYDTASNMGGHCRLEAG